MYRQVTIYLKVLNDKNVKFIWTTAIGVSKVTVIINKIKMQLIYFKRRLMYRKNIENLNNFHDVAMLALPKGLKPPDLGTKSLTI